MINIKAPTPRRISTRKRGQSLTEYGILLSFIAVVVIGTLMFAGDAIADSFTGTAAQIEQPGGGEACDIAMPECDGGDDEGDGSGAELWPNGWEIDHANFASNGDGTMNFDLGGYIHPGSSPMNSANWTFYSGPYDPNDPWAHTNYPPVRFSDGSIAMIFGPLDATGTINCLDQEGFVQLFVEFTEMSEDQFPPMQMAPIPAC